MLRGLVAPGQRSWIAHALLSITRIDLIEHLLDNEGWPEARIRQETRNYAELILGAAAPHETVKLTAEPPTAGN